MPQRIVKIYIENTLYKEVTVDVDENNAYAVSPILEIISADKEAGLLNNIPGYDANHLTIRMELGKP